MTTKFFHAAVLIATCAATAHAQRNTSPLAATPGWLCAGDEYSLQWKGGDKARLFVNGRDSKSDSVRLRAAHPGQLEARAADGRILATDTLEFHPDSMEHDFIRPETTCAGRLSLASMAIPPVGASDAIRARTVTNRSTVAVFVMHRGKLVRLAPGETTTAFADLPFSGDWGVVIDAVYNAFCPVREGSPTPRPGIDVRIVTHCALSR